MTTGYPYIFFDSLDSTNNYLKSKPDLWNIPFCTVHTHRQLSGRGRHGRVWHSLRQNLTFSFVYDPGQKIQISAITLFAGLALRKALSDHSQKDILLKWPNDVYFSGKKIGGILTEFIQKGNQSVIVFGIGVNIETSSLPRDLHDQSIGLGEISTNSLDSQKKLIDSIMAEMMVYLPRYCIPIHPDIITEYKNHYDYTQNKVSVFENGNIEKKIFNIRGIANNGNLIVEDEAGLRTLSDVFELQ